MIYPTSGRHKISVDFPLNEGKKGVNTPVKAIALGRDTASIDSILCKCDTKSEGILEKASLVKYVKAFMYCKNRGKHQNRGCRMWIQPEQDGLLAKLKWRV